jgi:hypothetical protein
VLWRNGEVHRRIPESGYLNIKTEGAPNKFNTTIGLPFLANDGSVYATLLELPRRSWNPDWNDYLNSYYSSDVAGFWKNGEVHYLDVPTDNGGASYARSIFVTSSNDVYIIGVAMKTDNREAPRYAILWKNGEPNYLSDGSRCASPSSVFALGEDVYVAGVEMNYYFDKREWKTVFYGHNAVLWKNGQRLHLEGSEGDSSASQVFVHGDNVYVGGRIGKDAVVWKNGTKRNLTDGSDFAICSLFVSGGDVYVVAAELRASGFYNGSAVIWKNDEKTILPTSDRQPYPEYYCYPGTVFVQGDDVYVAGGLSGMPVLWKNGALQKLPFAAQK